MYGVEIIKHYRNPKRFGKISRDEATSIAVLRNSLCGDEIEISVSHDGDVINNVMFTGDGCAICIASASLLADKANGLSINEATELSPADFDELKNIKGSRYNCANLAFEVLREVLKDE